MCNMTTLKAYFQCGTVIYIFFFHILQYCIKCLETHTPIKLRVKKLHNVKYTQIIQSIFPVWYCDILQHISSVVLGYFKTYF